MDTTNNPRQEKGKKIAENPENQIQRIDENHYKVKSQTTVNEYDVIATESGFICTCSDHKYRRVCCKHIHAVEFSRLIRNKVWKATHIREIEADNCKFCESKNIIKKGLRKNKTYSLQIQVSMFMVRTSGLQ